MADELPKQKELTEQEAKDLLVGFYDKFPELKKTFEEKDQWAALSSQDHEFPAG